MYFKTITIVLVSLTFLIACSTSKMAELAYPERLKYSFEDSTTDLTNTYLCKDVGGAEKTKARAKVAHLYLSKRIDEISTESVSKMMEGEKTSFLAIMKSQRRLQKNSKLVAEEIDAKFQCALISAE